ncbi:MAG TPA: aminoacyl-tRNA hydrolase [Solirubrobacterales bacterium]|nr:aminoacyl-tRNA hydrolase [Solirubrobacterales bacterium]
MSIFRRRGRMGSVGEAGDRVLVVGLGNPGKRYEATRHNVGAMVVAELERRWELGRPRKKFNGLLSEGRVRPGGPRVVALRPQTFMNESGRSVGPARGSLRVPLDRLLVVYDEIDLPFGEVRSKLGGGAAGHNGIKSLRDGLGSADFWRLRVGVGRPDSTDPEIVSAWVLGRFREPEDEVRALIDEAAREAERLVDRIASGEDE